MRMMRQRDRAAIGDQDSFEHLAVTPPSVPDEQSHRRRVVRVARVVELRAVRDRARARPSPRASRRTCRRRDAVLEASSRRPASRGTFMKKLMLLGEIALAHAVAAVARARSRKLSRQSACASCRARSAPDCSRPRRRRRACRGARRCRRRSSAATLPLAGQSGGVPVGQVDVAPARGSSSSAL